jgi:precorrin-2 dehydrogenase / sirohydrochlorin ferrochelatase
LSFDYPVNLDLAGRRAVVVGGGTIALERTEGLLASGALVTVVTSEPSPGLRGLVDAGAIVLHERPADEGDLDGAFLAIHTREDATDTSAEVTALWEHAAERGVLFAALDDIPHCMFGAASTIRRGDLRVTISTAGRAPALSKRLRRELETTIDDAHGELVDALHAARERVLPRDVDFATWAGRWEEALDDLDGLLELVRAGRGEEVADRVAAAVRPDRAHTPA